MITTEGTESIARPAADVFSFVSDVRNDPRWHTDVLEAQLTEGASVGQGSTFAIKIKPFMGQSEGTVTVLEYEPPSRGRTPSTHGQDGTDHYPHRRAGWRGIPRHAPDRDGASGAHAIDGTVHGGG